jgi:hypothetical protein
MARAQKPDFVFRQNGQVHLNQWGRLFSPLLAVEECGSAGSDCIIFSEYVDHSLKMSLQGGKKQVKRSDEREIVYNVYKFMKTESEVGITIPLAKVQKRVAEATCVSRRTLCRILKEGENVETGVAMAFSTPRKLRTKVCTKSILDNFNEAILRKIVHNFYLTEKQRPILKAIHSKMCESTAYGGGVTSLRVVLRKMGFR